MSEETKPEPETDDGADPKPEKRVAEDYDEARSLGQKRSLQKLIEKAFVVTNRAARWHADAQDVDSTDGLIGLQIASINEPDALIGTAMVLVQEIERNGEKGMYPLAILLDPKRQEAMSPGFQAGDYDELNERLFHIASLNMDENGDAAHPPEGFRYGDLDDLDKATPIHAQDEVERLIEWMEPTVDEASMNKVVEQAISDVAEERGQTPEELTEQLGEALLDDEEEEQA